MHKDKEKAYALRYSGKSYKEIREELDIPLGTLSGWFKKELWSQEIKQKRSLKVSLSNPLALKNMAQANSERWKLKLDQYRKMAKNDFERLKNDQLFLAGIILYWALGDKNPSRSRVHLSSGDPETIRLFYFFLTKTLELEVDKVLIWLTLYLDLAHDVHKKIWSTVTSIPTSSFKDSVYLKNKQSKKRNSYGTCNVQVNSRALKERLLVWIESYKNKLRF